MDKKDNENTYRAERKQRLAKAAKQKSKKKGNSTDVIANVIKVIAVIIVIGIACAALYAYGVPQSVLPALKVGDRTYSMSEYSYYYTSVFQTYANTAYSYVSQYGFNLSGFDYTISPADQTKKDDDGNDITWDQFFRDNVQETLETYNYYLTQAKEQGVTLSDESKEQIEKDISEIAASAQSYSFSTGRYISFMFGKGLNEKKLRSLLADQYLVAQMVELQENEIKKDITMDDIEAAYEEDPSDYLSVDLRMLGIAIEKDEKTDDTATTAAPEESEAESESETESEAVTETEAVSETESESESETETEEEAESETEATASEPSEAEILANDMLSKVTDEESFIELCKEYCAEDQKATFEDPSASLFIGIKKSTVSKNIDEELAEWLFSEDRQVGDKTVFVADDYAYVIMLKNTVYRDETPLASARHILVSFSNIAAELAAETAEEETPSEEVSEEPSDENTEETSEPATETNEQAEDTTSEAVDPNATLTASDGKQIKAEGTYSAEVVLKAYEKALEIYNEYFSGEQTEEAFAALAEKYSDDTASLSSSSSDSSSTSSSEGGLYTDINKGEMVEPFVNWVYDEARKPGDVGLIETSYGWHVMYYVSSHEEAQWIEEIRDSIVSDKLKEYEDGLSEEIKTKASTSFLTKLSGDAALKTLETLYGF